MNIPEFNSDKIVPIDNLNRKDFLSKFNTFSSDYNNALMAGGNDVISIITDNLIDELKGIEKDFNTYINQINEKIKKINGCKDIDNSAKIAAEKEYNYYMSNNKEDYTFNYDKNPYYDNEVKQKYKENCVSYYDIDAHIRDANAAGENTWKRNNCELWDD